jgi:hypothetical protein
MKKNATASKTSLRHIPLEESSTRQPLKLQQKSTVRGASSAQTAILKCNNCHTMVEKELMVNNYNLGRNYI